MFSGAFKEISAGDPQEAMRVALTLLEESIHCESNELQTALVYGTLWSILSFSRQEEARSAWWTEEKAGILGRGRDTG